MLTHILRDDAIRSWHLWLCVYLSIVMESSALKLGFGVNWFPLAVYLFFTLVKRRVSALDLALPLPARRLWLAHVLAIGLGGGLVLACGFIRRALLDTGAVWNPGAEAEMIDGTLRLGAGLVIAVAVLQSRAPTLARPPLALADIVVLAVVPGVVLLLDGAWVIALLVLALVLGFHTWRSLPAAFTLTPTAPREPPPTAKLLGPSPPGQEPVLEDSDKTVAGGAAGWDLRFKLLRYVWEKNPTTWLSSCFFGLLAAHSVSYNPGIHLDRLREIGLVLVVPMFVFPLLQLARLSLFDPLPIRRSDLFAALILPNAGALALGYGAYNFLFVGQGNGLELPFVLLALGLPCLLLLAIVFRSVKAAKAVAGLVILLILSLPVVIPPSAQRALDVFLRQLSESPAGARLAWLVTALLLLGGYALTRASFERIELPALLPQIQRDGRESLGGAS